MDSNIYTVIASDPDFKDVPYSKVVDYFSEKFNISKKEIKEIMYLTVQWTLDNKDNLREMVKGNDG